MIFVFRWRFEVNIT